MGKFAVYTNGYSSVNAYTIIEQDPEGHPILFDGNPIVRFPICGRYAKDEQRKRAYEYCEYLNKIQLTPSILEHHASSNHSVQGKMES